jgi:lipopolysaccharide/colanic/teichoic acid biosynthesis glycosyltransferase
MTSTIAPRGRSTAEATELRRETTWPSAIAERADERRMTAASNLAPMPAPAWPIELLPPVEARPIEPHLEAVPRPRSEAVSRVVNVVLAIVGLIVAMPLFAIIAVLIKLFSPGPVLYTQTRIGLDRRWNSSRAVHEARREDLGGRVFTIYKFRTMHIDAEHLSGAVWATAEDPRITSLGRTLRRYRIDELPQLWNVLLGDMNLVGPRPERPTIVARLRQEIPEYQYRHRVKPGITGLAQINQQYDASLDDVRSKVAWDLRYIGNQSVWLDLRVIIETIPRMLMKVRGW